MTMFSGSLIENPINATRTIIPANNKINFLLKNCGMTIYTSVWKSARHPLINYKHEWCGPGNTTLLIIPMAPGAEH